MKRSLIAESSEDLDRKARIRCGPRVKRGQGLKSVDEAKICARVVADKVPCGRSSWGRIREKGRRREKAFPWKCRGG